MRTEWGVGWGGVFFFFCLVYIYIYMWERGGRTIYVLLKLKLIIALHMYLGSIFYVYVLVDSRKKKPTSCLICQSRCYVCIESYKKVSMVAFLNFIFIQ